MIYSNMEYLIKLHDEIKELTAATINKQKVAARAYQDLQNIINHLSVIEADDKSIAFLQRIQAKRYEDIRTNLDAIMKLESVFALVTKMTVKLAKE